MAGQLKTIKDIVNDAALEMGITQFPANSVVTTADQDMSQLRSLMSAVADEIMMDEPYSATLSDGFWLMSEDGKTPKNRPTADSDLVLFDSRMAINGLKFRFLSAKGLEFGEALRDFAQRTNKVASALNGVVLDLDTDVGRDL